MNFLARISSFHSASASLLAMLLLASSAHAQELPTASGNEAVQQLKEQGQYESLIEAVNAARSADSDASGGHTRMPLANQRRSLPPVGEPMTHLAEASRLAVTPL